MRHDILVDESESVFLINAKERGDGYVRAGVLICVSFSEKVATFTLSDRRLRLLISGACAQAGEVTKAFNIDLPVTQSTNLLGQDEQVFVSNPW